MLVAGNLRFVGNLLDAKDVSFSYGAQRVLQGIDLAIGRGEVVALLGPNGSGKSTLIRLLLGQMPAATCSIAWLDRPIGSYSQRQLSRLIAYLPQSPRYEDGHTVLDVLRLGRLPYWSAFGLESARDMQVVDEVARLLELEELKRRRLDEISGGQRQRVFIGRCLVQEPSAVLLDEPATFLDLRHQLELHRLLRRLSREKNIAVLMASHDLNLAATHSDRLVILSGGRKVIEGPPEEALQETLLNEVYGVRLRRVEIDGQVAIFPTD